MCEHVDIAYIETLVKYAIPESIMCVLYMLPSQLFDYFVVFLKEFRKT